MKSTYWHLNANGRKKNTLVVMIAAIMIYRENRMNVMSIRKTKQFDSIQAWISKRD
jgi:hypothetical protein